MEKAKAIKLFEAKDGAVTLSVQIDAETVWLTRAQMAKLFGKDRSVIARHIHNAIAEGEISVDYEAEACTWTGIRSGASGELRGSLRVVSDNATGENRDFFFPLVSLAPTGDMPVIAEGTDFASMQFDVDILKPAGGEAIYVDGVALAS